MVPSNHLTPCSGLEGNIWSGALRAVDPDMPDPVYRIFTAIREHCNRYMCLPHHIFKPFDYDSSGYIPSHLIQKAAEGVGIKGFYGGDWRALLSFLDPDEVGEVEACACSLSKLHCTCAPS